LIQGITQAAGARMGARGSRLTQEH